jgi:hypothetical protein
MRYNVQLIVSMLGTDGRVGGEYDLSRFPVCTWAGLIGRDGAPLHVLVHRDHEVIHVRAGDVARQPHMLHPLR